MEIAIFGAFDRYNYGDLLFPLILKEYLPKKIGVNLNYYSLIEADFQNYGTVTTKPFSEFYNQHRNSSSKNIIIVAGGRVAAPKAGQLYSFLKHTPFLNVCSNFCKVFCIPNLADIIAQKKLGITWGDFPFCPVKPNEKTLLIYNAIGGNPKKIHGLMTSLQYADHLSIRNPQLFNGLKPFFNKKKLALCPDSATVMSNIWPKDTLVKLATSEAIELINSHKNGYIVFQAKQKTKRHINTIIHQLRQLYNKTSLPILLLPIGRAHRHEDHIFLSQLADRLKIPSHLVNITKLHDIMCVIAHSNLFIGTSLHGNITAISYAVPHLGITNIPKLDQYLKYWDIEPNRTTGTVKPSQICDAAFRVLQRENGEKLTGNAEQLTMLSENALRNISNLVNDYLKDN